MSNIHQQRQFERRLRRDAILARRRRLDAKDDLNSDLNSDQRDDTVAEKSSAALNTHVNSELTDRQSINDRRSAITTEICSC